MCVCVCVSERERERERESVCGGGGGGGGQSIIFLYEYMTSFNIKFPVISLHNYPILSFFKRLFCLYNCIKNEWDFIV